MVVPIVVLEHRFLRDNPSQEDCQELSGLLLLLKKKLLVTGKYIYLFLINFLFSIISFSTEKSNLRPHTN